MNTAAMDTAEMHAVMSETHAGELTFPHVVGRLLAVGVESYFVDFLAKSEVFYLADGQTYTETMGLAVGPVAEEFSGVGIVAAIREAQADTVRYPKFVELACAAGVAGYWAFLTGKKVVYFGRKGEMHVEEFPR